MLEPMWKTNKQKSNNKRQSLPVMSRLRNQRHAGSSGTLNSHLSLLRETQARERPALKTQGRQCPKASLDLKAHVHICIPKPTHVHSHTHGHMYISMIWPGMVSGTYNPNTWEPEARRSWVQGVVTRSWQGGEGEKQEGKKKYEKKGRREREGKDGREGGQRRKKIRALQRGLTTKVISHEAAVV